MDDAACFQTHHRLPDPGARNGEKSGQLIFAEPRARPDTCRKNAGNDGFFDIYLTVLPGM